MTGKRGLYYLQSRYYNPQWSRFLNADGILDTEQGLIGTNMYAYCENDPINMCDAEGESATHTFVRPTSLGKGWEVRVENHGTGNGIHIHIYNKKKGLDYAQRYDGGPSHKGKGGGGPPNTIKKAAKEKIGWDWDKRAKDYKSKQNKNKIKGEKVNVIRSRSGKYILVPKMKIPKNVPIIMPGPPPLPALIEALILRLRRI